MDCKGAIVISLKELVDIDNHILKISGYLSASKREYILNNWVLKRDKDVSDNSCTLSDKEKQSIQLLYNYRLGEFKLLDTTFNNTCIFSYELGGKPRCAIATYCEDNEIEMNHIKPKMCQ